MHTDRKGFMYFSVFASALKKVSKEKKERRIERQRDCRRTQTDSRALLYFSDLCLSLIRNHDQKIKIKREYDRKTERL